MESYKVAQSSKVQEAEKELDREIREIQDEIEKISMQQEDPTKHLISVEAPPSSNYFQKERKFILDNFIDFDPSYEVKNLSDVFHDQLQSTKSTEFSMESLPLLLLQFNLDRMSWLTRCKHEHMLRWRRFADHTNHIERLTAAYTHRCDVIAAEYARAKEASRRLSNEHRRLVMSPQDQNTENIRAEDMRSYCVWLICHVTSVKKITCFINALQWLPIKQQISNCKKSKETSDSTGKEYYKYRGDRPGSSSIQAQLSQPSSSVFLTGMDCGDVTAFSDSLPAYDCEVSSFRQRLESLVAEFEVEFRSNPLQTAGDEMELFGAVNRKFKKIFVRQINANTFYQYDNVPKDVDEWGVSGGDKCLLKTSTWLDHVTCTPRDHDVRHVRRMTWLRQHGKLDELLVSQNNFIKERDHRVVSEALKLHASAIRDPPPAHALDVTSNRNGKEKSWKVWERIYQTSIDKENERRQNESEENSSKLRSNEYDYSNTMQMFGLDEGTETHPHQNPANVIQGAYLSYLHLRHIKICDLRRKVLQLLNYFRSVERSLTISECGGFSLESKNQDNSTSSASKSKRNKNKSRDGTSSSGRSNKNKQKQQSSSNKKNSKKASSGSRDQTNHHHVFSGPCDYRADADHVMSMAAVANHDDFYSFGEAHVGTDEAEPASQNEDVPHVQDQFGYYVMYDAALEDMRRLDDELLRVASHYVVTCPRRSRGGGDVSSGSFEVDVDGDGRREVDRFEVLLDAWTCELNFHVNKRKVFDCLLEAYHNTFSPTERTRLVQVMCDVMHQRPRHDLSAEYFVSLYQSECVCLKMKCQLLTKVLVDHMDEQRQFINKACRGTSHQRGMPFHATFKQDISPNLPIPSLKHVDIMEFHPYLGALATRLCDVISFVTHDAAAVEEENGEGASVRIECEVLRMALVEWGEVNNFGATIHPDLDRDVFSAKLMEDPLLVCGLVDEMCGSDSSQHIQTWRKLLELVLLRHRLMTSSYHTEYLVSLYKTVAGHFGYPLQHAHLRVLEFDHAKKKEVDKSVVLSEKKLDRFTPEHMELAISELDITTLNKFSFKNRQDLIKVLNDPKFGENLKLALACQLTSENCFNVAIQQASHAMRSDSMSLNQKVEQQNNTNQEEQPNNNGKFVTMENSSKKEQPSRKAAASSSPSCKNVSFVSVQQEKARSRDEMMNEYLDKHKRGTPGSSKVEDGTKRTLISKYCKIFNRRVQVHALRSQIIGRYVSLLSLLQKFPQTLDTHFLVGNENEEKTIRDTAQGLRADPRVFNRRPRRVISECGGEVLNVWFIPHYSEVLTSFSHLDYEGQYGALLKWYEISSCLHEMIQLICARSRLGSTTSAVSADWGGIEGINNEIKEIQSQIDSLPPVNGESLGKNPCDVAELMRVRRKASIMQFQTTITDSVCENFLARGNEMAFKSMKVNSSQAFGSLEEDSKESFALIGMRLPQSISAKDDKTKKLYPWLWLESTRGGFPCSYGKYWQDIESRMQLCLANLTDRDRQIVNAELVAVGLLVDDVLKQGLQPLLAIDDKIDILDGHAENKANLLKHPLCKIKNPIISYKLIIKFLRLSKQLDLAKLDWASNKIQKSKINTTRLYKAFIRVYQNEIAFPAYCSMSRQAGNHGQYENITNEDLILPLPMSVPHIVVRADLLKRILEHREIRMIAELRHQIGKDMTSLASEQSRSDEGVVPLDLWDQGCGGEGGGGREENLVISSPSFYDEFVQRLMSDAVISDGDETEKTVSFKLEHLKLSLAKLASSITIREKDNFESYSTFYENLLQHQHQLLYKKELELEKLKKEKQNETSAHFQLADKSHELILEVTALRSKLWKMEKEFANREEEIRLDERSHCQDLIKDLFGKCFEMKMRLGEQHVEVHEDMRSLVRSTRQDAMTSLEKLRDQQPTSTAEERLKTIKDKESQLEKLQEDKHKLKLLFNKYKTFNHMRRTSNYTRYKACLDKMKFSIASTRRECVTREMKSREESELLREQLTSARKSLEQSRVRLEESRDQIELHHRMTLEKLHVEQLEKQNRQNLQNAQHRKMERLMVELHEKDVRLRSLTSDVEKNNAVNNLQRTRINRNMSEMETKLTKERSLKMEALERVDALQSAILYQDNFNNDRPPSEIRRPKSSAVKLSNTRNRMRPLTSSNVQSGQMRKSPNYTPAPLPKKQRPHTAGNIFLRDRIAATLMLNQPPPTTISEITELRE